MDKQKLIKELCSLTEYPDDDSIHLKEKIKNVLLSNPALLFCLHNEKFEKELFNEDGSINETGDWSLYYGENILPYYIIPETQSKAAHYICYKVEFDESPKYNKIDKYLNVTFVILCDNKDIIDNNTGVPRHDLIASIIREMFNWSNYFGTQCHIVSEKEGLTDNNYATKTLVFECITTNSITKTKEGKTSIINNEVWY